MLKLSPRDKVATDAEMPANALATANAATAKAVATAVTPAKVAAKAKVVAMIAATKALAQEVAKRKITINAVAPGFITSDMTKELDSDELKKLVPANRFGTADEVADLVSFLVSDKAGYITGEVININGGLYS